MHTFPTVEDYLEVIAGKRPLPGAPKNNLLWFGGFDPIISLARYDVQFLDSVTDATITGQPLSDKQAELACKIILKYQRQLHNKGIDIGPMQTPKYRKPLRHVDQSKTMVVKNDQIEVRFPFNEKLIESIRTGASNSQGTMKWHREGKFWSSATTEFNINWLVSWGKAHEFEIDPIINNRMQEILDMEKERYAIELCLDENNRLKIDNVPSSLLEYLQQDLEAQDLISLVDQSGILGYTVSQELEEQLISHYGIDIYLNMTARWRQLPQEDHYLTKAIEYARAVNRWPVCVYDPSATSSFEFYKQQFEEHEVFYVGNNKILAGVTDSTKLIWTHRPIKAQKKFPMLISYVGLLIGGDKNYMLQNSEKVFFYCADVMKTK